MAADEMQVRLTAKDDLTRELKNATKQIAKLESQLRDLDGATRSRLSGPRPDFGGLSMARPLASKAWISPGSAG